MEQKTFVLGITSIMTATDIPDEVKDSSTVAKLIQEVLVLLQKVKEKEQKEALEAGNKQIENESDDSYDDEDDESFSDEEEYEESKSFYQRLTVFLRSERKLGETHVRLH